MYVNGIDVKAEGAGGGGGGGWFWLILCGRTHDICFKGTPRN